MVVSRQFFGIELVTYNCICCFLQRSVMANNHQFYYDLYEESHMRKNYLIGGRSHSDFQAGAMENWEGANAENDSIIFTERDENDHKLFVEILCDLLDQVMIENEHYDELICSNLLIAFQGPSRSFTASYYISRMSRYSGAIPSCFIVALIYLDRFQRRVPCLRLTSRTLQRLLLVAAMTATKYIDDVPRLNSRW
jgi:hypothetical protein